MQTTEHTTSFNLKNRFISALSTAFRESAALNLPIVYRDSLCVTPDLFIHKYPDGRKLLIEQAADSFEIRVLRVLA